jgi:hypothetical protein
MTQQGTIIHGIAASQNLDSSGEVVDIAGLDISSLDKDGVLNWSHKSDNASQIIGKILKAKKIFSEEDAEDDHQLYFWNKCKAPYVYVVGELFDAQGHSAAKDVAAMFRYDQQNRGKHSNDVIGFSIEGAKLSKESNVITRSIGRKVTIDPLPCNKQAVAEIVPASGKKSKDDVDSIFKTESIIEIELIKKDDPSIWGLIKKENPKLKKDIGLGLSGGGASTALSGGSPMSSGGIIGKAEPKLKVASKDGIKIGSTKSGRDVMSHGRVGEYGFNPQEHQEAAAHHEKAATSTKNQRLARHHQDKAKLHMGASRSGIDAWQRRQVGNKDIAAKRPDQNAKEQPKTKKLHDPALSGKVTYKKSETHTHVPLKADSSEASSKGKSLTGPSMQQPRHRLRESSFSKQLHREKFSEPKDIPKHKKVAKGEAEKQKGSYQEYTRRGEGVTGHRTIKENSLNPNQSNTGRKQIQMNMKKALTAGSQNAAPGQLVGGAALGQEGLTGTMQSPSAIKPQNVNRPDAGYGSITHKPGAAPRGPGKVIMKSKKMKKSEMLQRAEEEYAKWSKREEFESFMAKRMPSLTRAEIQTIGKTIALSKSIKAEKKLSKLTKESASQNYMHSYIAKSESKGIEIKDHGISGKDKIPSRDTVLGDY